MTYVLIQFIAIDDSTWLKFADVSFVKLCVLVHLYDSARVSPFNLVRSFNED